MESVKTVIFCGGKGTRLREMTDLIPKPLAPLGNKPILWHIMKIYSSYGFKDFVLCLGHKGEMVKDYFLKFNALNNDFSVNVRENKIEILSGETEDWSITLADTGHDTLTSDRLAAARKYVGDRFFVTYGDGVANINIKELLDFHAKKGKTATITAGHPYSKYGMVEASPDKSIVSFKQKPVMKEYINIGFMVFEKEIFDFLKPGQIEDTLSLLADKNQLAMFPHEGFFHAMDTYKDYEDMNDMWNKGFTPWKIWGK